MSYIESLIIKSIKGTTDFLHGTIHRYVFGLYFGNRFIFFSDSSKNLKLPNSIFYKLLKVKGLQ